MMRELKYYLLGATAVLFSVLLWAYAHADVVASNPIVGWKFGQIVSMWWAPGQNQNSGSSGNVAATATTATLTANGGATENITGFTISGLGATAGSAIAVTVTGLAGGTQTYEVGIPAGVTTPMGPFQVNFNPPYPASGVGVNIVVNVPSFGSGNTNASVVATGYNQF
jgi:hypothetical protein